MNYYGRGTSFKNCDIVIKNMELHFNGMNIHQFSKSDDIYALVEAYLSDTGLIEDPESLLQTFKYPDLISSIFTGRHFVALSMWDSEFSESREVCGLLYNIAVMEKDIPITEVFTDEFLTNFFEDMSLLIEDIKTVSSIYQ